MPFLADVFTHLFSWDQDPQRQEKIVNARLEAEFDGIDTALTTVSTDLSTLEGTAVTAAATFANDNRALRSDGTGRGAQSSGVTIDDSNNVTTAGVIRTNDTTAATGGGAGAMVCLGGIYISKNLVFADTTAASGAGVGALVAAGGGAYFGKNLFIIDSGGNGSELRGNVGFGAAFGYSISGFGSGGTVTQATSKSTGVTLDKYTGQITMHNATLNAGTSVSFTLTNNKIGTTDVIIVNIDSAATASAYFVGVEAVGAGSCAIHLRNVSGSNLGEAIVLNFVVVKGIAN